MFWLGSLMSQVLQCTQFCALIWNFGLPSRLQHFVDASRAIALRRLGVLRQVDLDGDCWILQLQMDRLILFVVGLENETEVSRSKVSMPSGFG